MENDLNARKKKKGTKQSGVAQPISVRLAYGKPYKENQIDAHSGN